MHNVSGYITAFYCAASLVVMGITDDEMLDRFVVGLKAQNLRIGIAIISRYPLKKACVAAERVGVVFMDIGSRSFFIACKFINIKLPCKWVTQP